ncbi:hypothetical protein QQP08_000811 [Theobroma cacao]|nr:hypothetical protein QQP08_000811 [Theobroma cacao]
MLSSLAPFPNAISLNLVSPLSSARSPPSLFSRAQMSSESLPPLPQHRIVLGCGAVSVDFLATVASYPNPDDKIRSTSLKVQGGGNAGNSLTCAARLGLNPRLISKALHISAPTFILFLLPLR